MRTLKATLICSVAFVGVPLGLCCLPFVKRAEGFLGTAQALGVFFNAGVVTLGILAAVAYCCW